MPGRCELVGGSAIERGSRFVRRGAVGKGRPRGHSATEASGWLGLGVGTRRRTAAPIGTPGAVSENWYVMQLRSRRRSFHAGGDGTAIVLNLASLVAVDLSESHDYSWAGGCFSSGCAE